MTTPLNINLNVYTSDKEPLKSSKYHIKNILKFINNEFNYKIKSYSNEYFFTFPRNKNPIKYKEFNTTQAYFLNHGSNSVVFIIETKEHEYKILKISQNEFDVEKYLKLKNLFYDNIPNVYFYGSLFNEHFEEYYEYIITDIIKTNFNILEFDSKYLYLKNLTKLILNFHENQYIFNDLKLSNVGYDNNFNVVIVDYENFTVFHFDDDLNNLNFTFLPHYAFNFFDPINKNINKNLFFKLEILGWFDVALKLFFHCYYIQLENIIRKIGVDFFFFNFECVMYKNEFDCLEKTNAFCDTSMEDYTQNTFYYDVCNVNLKNTQFINTFLINLKPLPYEKMLKNIKIIESLKNIFFYKNKNILSMTYENIPSFVEIIHTLNYDCVHCGACIP